MEDDEDILNDLKFGSKDEIGRAITELSRHKDPRYTEILKKIMNSDDPFLAVMAAYALGEAGDDSGFQFLEKILNNTPNILASLNKLHYLEILEEILKLPDTINHTFDLYNSSYFIESKEKLLKILNVYNVDPPKMNVPYFDDLIAFSVKKTKGMILDALAVSEFHLGNIDSALQYSLEAITIAQEAGDPQLLKIAYADMGYFHMSLGNYYSALELIHESLEIDQTSHDPWRKRNRALSNLSQLYYLVGQYEKALEYIQEALELSEKENDLNGKARCLNTKAVILCDLNEFGDAEECLKEALTLSRNELNDKTLESLILTNLSYVYWSLSGHEKAKEYLENALELSQQMADKSAEASILANMAMLELESDNIEEARRNSEAALDISAKIYNHSVQADANFILGTIEDYWYDNPDKACEYYKESISISETLRKNLLLDDFKISFAGNYVGLYQQMIALCIRMGKTKDAFEYIEKSKSRALVDMLCHAMNEIGSKKVPDETLDEIDMLKGKLDVSRRKLNSLYSNLDKETTNIDDGVRHRTEKAITEEMNKLERSYKKAFEELKMKDPEWASLVSVDVINLEAIQSILDKETLLLEFYQTNEEVIIISVKKDKPPSVIKIPIDIESDSESLYSLFTAMSEGRGIDTRSHEYIKYIKRPLSYFHDLLISPLIEEIRDIEHLIIAPHYFWHYLPFHALFDSVTREHLIDKFCISYIPSVSVLNFYLKKNHSQYNNVLILANPSNDLPFAEEEAEKVKARFNSSAYLFKGKDASFDKLSDYSKSDIIHLACHTYFRGDEPLFSHLVFSDSNHEESRFFLPDIFNLKLKSSLVTLSACETGLSQFTAGDELIGISRAFFYAGTPSLLTSHWTVNDKSTSILMDKFYEGLVSMGESKARALKLAMLELKAMPEYSHPYFWAPFFLSGDWR